MWTWISESYLTAFVGLIGGIGLGLAARRGRFCTLGAIEDYLYGGSDHRLRMWGMAMGVALIATFGMMGTGFLDAGATPYLTYGWNPLGHIIGGIVFGVGMAMAGNCGYGALARLGGGDLRSFVIVLVMGISAYFFMNGPLAGLRVWLFPPDLIKTDTLSGIAHLAGDLTRTPPAVWGISAGVLILAFTLSAPDFRTKRSMVFWGGAVGAIIAFGWAGTQWVSIYSFGAVNVESFTFAAPLGDAIMYGMLSTVSEVNFDIASVAGVWTGALLGSYSKGHFRWEACEDPRELRRQIFGAFLMGGGAVIAIGCTVGQGISAISVLSFGAPLTLAGIYIGASLGLKSLIAGFSPM